MAFQKFVQDVRVTLNYLMHLEITLIWLSVSVATVHIQCYYDADFVGFLFCAFRMRVQASLPPLMLWLQERMHLRPLGITVKIHQTNHQQYVVPSVLLCKLYAVLLKGGFTCF